MAIETPNLSEVINRILTSIKNQFTGSNPFLRNSFINILGTSLANIVYDLYDQLKTVIFPNIFPQTATGDYIEDFGEIKGITRNSATKASGFITATGTVSTSIPKDTELQSSDGYTYKTLAAATILANSISVSSLTQTGGIATATTASAHNLGTGIDVTISGANESEYNGTFSITVTGLTTFTYSVDPGASSPATGTILAAYDTASIEVESDDFGEVTNIDAGASLTFTSPISGVNDTAIVQYSAIVGGTDIESDEDYRDRVIEKWQSVGTPFNVANITSKAKEIAGVTRVWVEEATPALGQVTIYFVRDNDTNIIPDSSEITETKNKILEIKPAHVTDSDVIVSAPTAVTVNFNFSSLTPNTQTMQDAIENSLEELFSTQTEVGEDLLELEYNSVIINTVDETGAKVQNFTLSTPSGDVSISSGQIAVLGTVTF